MDPDELKQELLDIVRTACTENGIDPEAGDEVVFDVEMEMTHRNLSVVQVEGATPTGT